MRSIQERIYLTEVLYQLQGNFQPQATKQKKREEFDTWYAAELERDEEYVLWDELNKYCHYDVIIFKAACLKFIQEFQN